MISSAEIEAYSYPAYLLSNSIMDCNRVHISSDFLRCKAENWQISEKNLSDRSDLMNFAFSTPHNGIAFCGFDNGVLLLSLKNISSIRSSSASSNP